MVEGAVLADEDDDVLDRRSSLLMIGVDAGVLAQGWTRGQRKRDEKYPGISRPAATLLKRKGIPFHFPPNVSRSNCGLGVEESVRNIYDGIVNRKLKFDNYIYPKLNHTRKTALSYGRSSQLPSGPPVVTRWTAGDGWIKIYREH